MGAPKPPTWDDIQHLIERVDEVCRESEMLRAQAERQMRRRDFWPDRRQPPRRHGITPNDTPPNDRDTDRNSEGSDGTL
jgi:hypothetical protein